MNSGKDSTLDAAGCLGAMPSRAGMTEIGNRMAMEQYAKDGKALVIDSEASTGLTEHRFFMGPTRTGKSLQLDNLISKTVQLGVMGGNMLPEKKIGVRNPLPSTRKAKARKATKAAAKSRRRNRQ